MVSTKQLDYQKATKELSPRIKFFQNFNVFHFEDSFFFQFFPISFCHLSSTIQHNQILIVGLGWGVLKVSHDSGAPYSSKIKVTYSLW